MNIRRTFILFVTAIAISACAGLPPKHPTPQLQDRAPLPSELSTAGETWPAANWWEKYQDATLNDLMARALANAPSMAAAEARFASARESIRVAAAAAGLQVEAQGSLARQRLSDNGLFPPQFLGFHWYNQADLGLRATYNFDWWHKRRYGISSAISAARAAQAERTAAALTLSSAIADGYFGWQADQAQLALVRAQQTLVERRQAIAQARLKAELEAADTVYALEAEVAALRETALGLQYSAELRRVMLAALLGSGVDQLPEFTAKPLPAVDARLPDNVRVDLLSHRADITASRWQVEAAEQRLGAARAEFMPDISISALAGLSSIDLGKLLDYGSRVPSVNAAIHLPIFDSGLLHAQYGARAALLEAAIASYNDTLVNAARDVAAQAITLEQLAAQRQAREAQLAAVTQQVALANRRTEQGINDARQALQLAQALQQQKAALTTLQAAALAAEIKLIAALGGGYRAPPSDDREPQQSASSR